MKGKRKLRIGDWIEVRSKEEILSTLNADGQLEGMPFMPEMLAFCGQRFQVHKIAHKTCDYSGVYPFPVRRLTRTVHLQTRCDGKAHGGCEAGCLLYWKEDWLKPVTGDKALENQGIPEEIRAERGNSSKGPAESVLFDRVLKPSTDGLAPIYVCQMTQIPEATTPLAWWDLSQYVQDYRSGNVGIKRLLTALFYWPYYSLSQAGVGLGPAMRWLYNLVCPLWGGSLFPRTQGRNPEGQPTPLVKLNLRPGETVRVKSHKAILETVDKNNKNRGMSWDAELVPYCGGTYKVLRRVTRQIDERSGKMVEMKNACIVLDSVVCQARYSACRMFCPKAMYPYWREAWLERVESETRSTPATKEPISVGAAVTRAEDN
jgi:hypothetical protein